jgi:diaminohydroxyphosphoribosylaminopyrimidine deaminase / 5-amino-6-(5-phosphoribosylamino)uracil reductase
MTGIGTDTATAGLTEAAILETAVRAALRGPRGANPLVGAVITTSREVVVTGHHRGRGTAHAEVDALEQFRAGHHDPAEATLWVTLEPCDHTGSTGPCTEAILASGIRSVRYAVADPTGPDGGGAARLRAAGLDVRQVPGAAAEPARSLNRRWLAARDARRPFVTGHLAQSLDGRVAAQDGTSRWITGPDSRSHAHEVRSRVDAIVVGTGTVLVDDPRLTARRDDGTEYPVQPVPVVQGLRDVPRDWLHVRSHDPAEVLAGLAARGGPWPHGGAAPGHLLIEGGPTVLSAWLAADLVDELFVYQAPLVIGHGPSGLAWPANTTLAQARTLTLDEAETGGLSRLGHDVLIHLTA